MAGMGDRSGHDVGGIGVAERVADATAPSMLVSLGTPGTSVTLQAERLADLAGRQRANV